MVYRKMSESDVHRVLHYIADATHERLTWQMLEDHSGFTRQALQARDDIKGAYDSAKNRIRSSKLGLPREEITTELASSELLEELQALRKKVKMLEWREELWRRRWYCIAFNVRQKNLVQMVDVDKSVPLTATGITQKLVNQILDSLDQDIPPVAHRTDD